MQEPNDANTARVTARFVPLRAKNEVGSLFERSHDVPVILFQHDSFCPISQRAYRELTGMPIEVTLVDLARHADISRTIEVRTRVPHECRSFSSSARYELSGALPTSRLPTVRLRGRCATWHLANSTSSQSRFAPLADVGAPLGRNNH
jgi:bacillithiol system protein YtxJ